MARQGSRLLITALLCALLLGGAAGCGQKGDLFLPAPPGAQTPQPEAPGARPGADGVRGD